MGEGWNYSVGAVTGQPAADGILAHVEDTAPLKRRPFVPRAVIAGAAACMLTLISAGIAIYVVAGAGSIVVPYVTGLPRVVAEESLAASGLKGIVSGTRVSPDVPEGQVLAQDPPAGSALQRGSVVSLVLSVGPQSVTVPDLAGERLETATSRLEQLGLVVTIETKSADTTESIVLEVSPPPGTMVNAGDQVRLTIPAYEEAPVDELPYDLSGMTIVVDPSPALVGEPSDAAMLVAERLRELLSASGASVTMTRQATDSVPPIDTRLATARSSGARLLLGIDVGSAGTPGVRVVRPSSATANGVGPEAQVLAQNITRAARLPGTAVNDPGVTAETVVSGFAGVGVRVVIGDATVGGDRALLADSTWLDQVARSLYRGVGATFGTERHGTE